MACPGRSREYLIIIAAIVALAAGNGKQNLDSYRESSECESDAGLPCVVEIFDTVANTVSPAEERSTSPTESQSHGGESSSEEAGSGHPGGDPYDVGQGRYWLVPPFLIGASSVIALYITVHCIYLHCYAKQRMRKLEENSSPDKKPDPAVKDGADAANIHDSLPPDVVTVPPVTVTPVVRYDGAYGKTEVVETQPFLVCQPLEPGDENAAGGIQLQLPSCFAGRHSESRQSVSSSLESYSTAAALEREDVEKRQTTRTSICFVPVGHTVKDSSSGGQAEWTPLQGFMYSSFILRKPSYNQAVHNGPVDSQPEPVDSQPDQNDSRQASAATANFCREDGMPSLPVVIVPTENAESFHSMAAQKLPCQDNQENVIDTITVSCENKS